MKIIIKLNLFLILFVSLFACSLGSRTVDVSNRDLIDNPYIAFNPPIKNWYYLKGRKWLTSANKKKQRIYLDNHIHTSMGMVLRTDPYRGEKLYFDKNVDYEAGWEKHIRSARSIKINERQDITYYKYWVPYIQGLKCSSKVFLRGVGGSYSPSGYKQYNIDCGYYDKTVTDNEGRRIISIQYSATFSNKESDEQKQAKQKVLKDAVKQVVNSLKIKNMDVERMEAEGLMHYDKLFESTKW